jgi:hypothetical protein
MTTTSLLMLFREVIAVYSENRMKSMNLCGQNAELSILKSDGTYAYHWALRGFRRIEVELPAVALS